MTDILEDDIADAGYAVEFQARVFNNAWPHKDIESSMNALFAEGWNIDSSIPMGNTVIIIFVRTLETEE